ncbi:hypothetical protein STEG23_012357 [Scotinomys teguina]
MKTEETSDPLQQDLRLVVCHQVSVGTKPRTSTRAKENYLTRLFQVGQPDAWTPEEVLQRETEEQGSSTCCPDTPKNHLEGKPYDCNQSYKAFTRHSLHHQVHRIQTREKRYEYQQCDKAFPCPTYVQIHNRGYTTEKPYECNQCGKASAYNSHLSHLKSHTGEKPYEINQCGKDFTQKSSLYSHESHCTGDKCYECNQCDKSLHQRVVFTVMKELLLK